MLYLITFSSLLFLPQIEPPSVVLKRIYACGHHDFPGHVKSMTAIYARGCHAILWHAKAQMLVMLMVIAPSPNTRKHRCYLRSWSMCHPVVHESMNAVILLVITSSCSMQKYAHYLQLILTEPSSGMEKHVCYFPGSSPSSRVLTFQRQPS